MMQKERKYDAFISYRHLKWDMKVAEKLQKLLEKQKIKEENGTGKKRALQIFRDQSELPTSNDLGKDIRTALDNSRYLIVICSRTYQDSKWCMEEVEYFRSLHGYTNKNILPLLIEGEPDESFPEQLLWEQISEELGNGQIQKRRIEPLAADIRAVNLKKMLKKLEATEYLRIAAPILGVAFDDLYQRRKRTQRRMIAALSAGITIFSLAFGVYSWYMFRQISDRQSKIFENESIRLASSSESQMKNQDYMLALLLANESYTFHKEADTKELNSKAATALRSTVFGKRFEMDVLPLNNRAVIPFNTESWTIEKSLDDGKILQIVDGESTYLCDTANGEILQSFTGNYYVFSDDISLCVRILRLDSYQVMFQGIHMETGEVYFEYMAECRPASYINAFYNDETNDCYFDVDGFIDTYASAEGEILSCAMETDWNEGSLPDSVWSNICLQNQFQSSQENCDFVINSGDSLSEFTESECFIIDTMNSQGYLEIQLTNYNDNLILISGKREGSSEEYETWICSRDSGEIIYTLDGRYLLDRNNSLLYQRQESQLVIYEVNFDNLRKNLLQENTVFYWVSDDGNRCCLLSNQLKDENGLACDYALVEVFDVGNMSQALFHEYVAMGDPSSIKYQINSDMSKIIYEATDKTVHIQEIGGDSMQTISFEADEYVYAVAINDSGNKAAVSYIGESTYIDFYDIEQSNQIRQIDLQKYRGSIASITHIEITDDFLLVADYDNVYLFELQKQIISDPQCFSGSDQMSPSQHFLTEDGLLFCTVSGFYDVEGRQLYYLDKIYDIESGECILDVSIGAYDYDSSTGYLVYQSFTEYGSAPSVTVMQRNEDGTFQEIWSIKSDNVNMELLHNGMSLDGNMLLLSGKNTCEVYDLTTQYKIIETGFPGFSLKNQKLYYLAANSDDELMNWILWENLDSLQNKALELLAGRVFSEEEQSRYYILSR